jgi:protein-S-isoprenylcysteine O-methyltransferase Ste14
MGPDTRAPASRRRRPRTWRWRNVPMPEQHLVAMAAAIVLDRRRPWGQIEPTRARKVVGWALVGSGAGIVVASTVAAEAVELDRPGRLVTRGPYRLSRNPMYLGWSALHLGAGLLARSRWLLASLPAAWVAVHRQVLREERVLADTFGPAFEAYRGSVPRYLPRW